MGKRVGAATRFRGGGGEIRGEGRGVEWRGRGGVLVCSTAVVHTGWYFQEAIRMLAQRGQKPTRCNIFFACHATTLTRGDENRAAAVEVRDIYITYIYIYIYMYTYVRTYINRFYVRDFPSIYGSFRFFPRWFGEGQAAFCLSFVLKRACSF